MPVKYSRFYCFIILLLLNNTAYAQSSRHLTVDELFQLGIENSIQIKSAQLNEKIATEQLKTAQNTRLPEVNAAITGGYIGQPTVYQQGLTGATHPDMPNWKQNYNIEMNQPLFHGRKIKYSIEKAGLEKQIASLSIERDKAEIKLLLIGKYLDLFRLYKQQEVLTRNIEEAEQRLHDIQQMRKQGMITQNDVIRSELQLTNYQLDLRSTNNNISIISQQLDIALGLEEDLLLIPDTTLFRVIQPIATFEQYIEQAYQNFPELKIIQSDINIAQKNIQISYSNYLPSLDLHAGNTLGRPITGNGPTQDLFMNSWNISLTLSYPLSSLYRNRHTVNAVKQSIQIEQNREELQKQNIRSGIKTSYIKHQEARDRIGALITYVKQAEENYRIVRNKYLNQLAILTDLLDAENLRLDAELQLTAARANEIYTWYDLQRVSGSL